MTNKSRVVPRCHPRAGMRAIMDLDRNELLLVCAEITAPNQICGNEVGWFKTSTYDFSAHEDVDEDAAEGEQDVVEAIEEAARLARVGQVSGAVLFLAYHTGSAAFRMANVRARDAPPLALMMHRVADNISGQWMETVIQPRESLAPTLSAAKDEDDDDSES